jgi:hypothetical protein
MQIGRDEQCGRATTSTETTIRANTTTTITIRRPSTDGTCSMKIICRPDLQGKTTYRLDSSSLFCALLLFLDATQNYA